MQVAVFETKIQAVTKKVRVNFFIDRFKITDFVFLTNLI